LRGAPCAACPGCDLQRHERLRVQRAAHAQFGRHLILASGSYGALNKTLVSSIADDATAQSDPIFVYAAVNGGVDVTAPSQITLQGRGIVLAGLDFVAGSGMLDNGGTEPAWIIRTASDSRYMTISNVRFLNATTGDDYGHWIYVEGFEHTIEYCHFEGKSTRNATVAFKRNTAEAGITTKRNHRLRYCYFGPRECSTTENGFETIRIGDSSSQAHDMSVVIERNVFYRAIWRNDGQKPNDMEIISNKSKGNQILNNTFLESYGQITLRHGDACVVDGNFVFGAGSYSGSTIVLGTANSNQGGVRIIGQDHHVRNNYFVNLIGTNLRAALCLMAGATTWSDGNGSGGNNGYESAANASIYNNTFIDCREINLGYVDTGSLQPTGVRLFNNAWQGSGTSNGIVRNASFTPQSSGGNYIYHPSGSYGWTGLGGTYSSTVSPAITDNFDHYKIPTASSPLLNLANTTLVAANDIRNLARPASGRDIGSFEREVAGSGARPLLRAEVGPEFSGGPGGTYPDPGTIDTQPNITTTSLPAGTVGAAYSQALAAAGGELPLAWSISAGALPAGLSLSSGGVISGTPTTAGTANLTARVQDADADFDTQALSLVVNPSGGGGDPEIVPVSSPDSTSWDTAGSNGPANLWDGDTIDGGNDSRWASNSSPSTLTAAPRYVVLDLGATYNLSKFVVYPYQSRAYHHEIYVSNSTSSWGTAVVNVQPATGASSYTHNVSATGRYVRLVVDGISGTSTTWASINELDVFGTPAGNSAPTVSDIANQTTTTGAAVGPLSFTITDENPSGVTMNGSSSNTTLVPNANITFGGSGTNRTVTVTPAAGQTGTATITVTANDGSLTGSDTFTLTVNSSGGTGAFLMAGNQVVMEAENANSRTSGGGKSWTNITLSGASGTASNNAIESTPNSGTTASAPGTSTCRADYQIVVPSGAASTFYVHVRANGPSGSDDSVFISVNGSTSTYQQFNTTSALGWKTANSTISLPAGTQTLTIWMREDGTRLDKIVISSSSTLPTGTGPAESARQ
jgi:hypothetical protein